MKTLRFILFCLIIASACTPKKADETAAPSQDSVVVAETPKVLEPLKAGDITLDSLFTINSESDLRKLFGNAVSRSIGYGAEGEGEYPNTLLFADTENQVELVWSDTVQFTKADFLRTTGKTSSWKTRDGISLGTTLKELEKINGKAFTFYGFGWDYGGSINWRDGKLSKHVYASLGLPQDEVPKEFDGLMGDGEFNSQDKLAQKANPIIMDIRLQRE